jgi:hypothetical protein
MGDFWRVVPQALRDSQVAFDDTADRWEGLYLTMPDWRLDDGDLGLLGRVAGVVKDYNQAVDTITAKTQTGLDSFRAMSQALDDVARTYEALDEKYYEAFGYLDKNRGRVPPPPTPSR